MATKKKKKPAPKKKLAAKKKKTKAAPKKKLAAKKKAPPKKAPKKSTPKAKKHAVAAKKPARRKPIKRRDATGHLDPNYERDLLRKSHENDEHDDDRGFLVGKNRNDGLGQELGREYVETVTSGEDAGNELRDQNLDEEVGGPFVISTAGQELAEGTDESNPAGAMREPFPKS